MSYQASAGSAVPHVRARLYLKLKTWQTLWKLILFLFCILLCVCSGEETRVDREKILRALLMTELWDPNLWSPRVLGCNQHLYICIKYSAVINIYLHKGNWYICLNVILEDGSLYSSNWDCINYKWDSGSNGLTSYLTHTYDTDKLQMWLVLPAW